MQTNTTILNCQVNSYCQVAIWLAVIVQLCLYFENDNNRMSYFDRIPTIFQDLG